MLFRGDVGCGHEGIVRIWCRVQYCNDFGVLKDICLHRVRGWSSYHNNAVMLQRLQMILMVTVGC